MKKVIFLYIIITLWCYGYDYPYKDPYLATVLATPSKDMSKFENINYKEIGLNLKGGNVPPNLWYLNGFKFGLMAQRQKAPLIFLLAGTGAQYNSYQMITMSRILYQNGFSVIMLPTSFDYNFIVSASKTHAPGFLKKDSSEVYDIMKLAFNKIKNKVQYDDIYLAGYSLGGTTALVVGEIDNREKVFNFKRIAAVNPTVNLYDSAKILDDLLDDNIKSEKELDQLLQKVILGVMQFSQNDGITEIDEAAIYSLFNQLHMDKKELKTLIGIAFRFISIDINYITDIMTNSGVYTDPDDQITKFQDMSTYYSTINYSDFQDYIERVGFKTHKKLDKTLTMEKMIENSSLKIIHNYLKDAENIAVFTNEDELILTSDNLKYLKNTMEDKIKVYPYGGHCGNMFYKDNIASMINYLKRGELR